MHDDPLKELTIFIPTYHRQHLITPILDYYADTGASVIIGDATSTPWHPLGTISNKNFLYQHMPESSYWERFNYAVQHCRTTYFVPRADRRHQTINFLIHGVEFLNKNGDYNNVFGLWFSDNLTPDSGIDLVSRAGELDNKYERLINHALSYQPSYYSVQRIANVRVISELMKEAYESLDNPYIVEYVISFFSYLSGKVKQLPMLQGINQTIAKYDDYTSKWREVPYLLSNTVVRERIYDMIRRNFTPPSSGDSEFREQIFKALDYFMLRFHIKNISSHKSFIDYSTILPRFALIEKEYSNLNSHNHSIDDNDLAIFRLLLNYYFDNNISFDDYKKILGSTDQEEIKKIMDMITYINQSAH